jgi:hypothetical protein
MNNRSMPGFTAERSFYMYSALDRLTPDGNDWSGVISERDLGGAAAIVNRNSVIPAATWRGRLCRAYCWATVAGCALVTGPGAAACVAAMGAAASNCSDSCPN